MRVEHYGYALRKALAEQGIDIDENTLYPLLRRLESQGLLESTWREENKRNKRFYHLSAAGRGHSFPTARGTAIGLLAACHRRGLSVRDNLSIIGFDDIDMAAYTIPPLTTIRQPRFELGQRAMHMMLALLDDQKPGNQVMPVELVVRQTTAQLLTGINLGAAS
ncbi:MAG TPA: substrate-binding domain-containing protein [Ktedonobacteraceae bacterium]